MLRPCYSEHSRTLSHKHTKAIIVEFSAVRECGMSAQQDDICHSPHPTSILSQVLRIVRSFPSENKPFRPYSLAVMSGFEISDLPRCFHRKSVNGVIGLLQRACYTVSITTPKRGNHGHSRHSGTAQTGSQPSPTCNCSSGGTRLPTRTPWPSAEGKSGRAANPKASHHECSLASQNSCGAASPLGKAERECYSQKGCAQPGEVCCS